MITNKKVSMINLNLVPGDAVGRCILEMAAYFASRGNEVRIYTEYPPEFVPDPAVASAQSVSLGRLIGGEPHFAASDLLIYHYPLYYGLLESMRGASQGAVMIDYHGVTPPELWGSEYDRELLVRGQQGLPIALYADVAAAHSPFTAHELAAASGYPESDISILPLWVDTDAFQPGRKDTDVLRRHKLEGRRVLLCVGRIAGNKRIDVLVRAMARVQASAPDTSLLLVGDADSSSAYRDVADAARRLAKKLMIEEQVIFAGKVEDLPAYYRAADIYITASDHEGFGIPVLEAMACGVPVVAAASSALPWTVGDAGVTFPPGDDASLADHLLALLADAERRRTLSARGLKRAEQFNRAAYHSRLAQLSAQAFERRGRSPRPRQSAPHNAPADTGTAGPVPLPESDSAPTPWDALFGAANVAIPNYRVSSARPIVGPPYAWLRQKFTAHLRQHYLDPAFGRQAEFNARLLFELRDQLGKLHAGQQHLAQSQRELGRHIERLAAQIDELVARNMLDEGAPHGSQKSGYSYLSCQLKVGGDLEIQRRLYSSYLALFHDSQPVLDIGCGRGVFLQLCREQGLSASGVDQDPEMVRLCREQGLEVSESEALQYLEHIPEAALGGIFCAHVIEHLSKPRLVRLLQTCRARLRPGAPLVLVTPNGGGLTIFHATFYKDPTHLQPIHPEALQFLLEAMEFERVSLETISGLPEEVKLRHLDPKQTPPEYESLTELLNDNFARLNELLFGNLDCTAVAWRPL
jgi:glycosyltransferase involved in cell wall biosynthesis/2-polyprenyl-3-methyl-5-hydroxy-6-metoxy-1,4-benzoquinol methylase